MHYFAFTPWNMNRFTNKMTLTKSNHSFEYIYSTLDWGWGGVLSFLFCIFCMAYKWHSHHFLYFVHGWEWVFSFIFCVLGGDNEFCIFCICIKGDKSFLYFLYVLVVGEYSIPGSHVWHMSHTSLNHFISGYSFSCQGLKKEENVFNNSSRITTIKISFTCKIRSTLALITADWINALCGAIVTKQFCSWKKYVNPGFKFLWALNFLAEAHTEWKCYDMTSEQFRSGQVR